MIRNTTVQTYRGNGRFRSVTVMGSVFKNADSIGRQLRVVRDVFLGHQIDIAKYERLTRTMHIGTKDGGCEVRKQYMRSDMHFFGIKAEPTIQ